MSKSLTWTALKETLETTGYPCAYDHFDADETLNNFIAVIESEVKHLYADNINIDEFIKYDIEFYSRDKDIEGEKKIETALQSIGVAWKREPSIWISEAQRYLTVYKTR